MRLAPLLVIAVAAACHEPRQHASLQLDPPPERAPGVPTGRDAFLRELLPLDHDTLHATYDVRGPSGIDGRLEVFVKPGGFRREQWSLAVRLEPGQAKAVHGATIRTPEWQWTDAVSGMPVLTHEPIAALADVYASLPASEQTHVVARIREWHHAVQHGRAAHPGERDTVLGRSCLVTHVNRHRVCVWEETGLVLSYRSDAFTVEAREIVVDAPIDPALFEIPPGDRLPPADAEAEDPRVLLERFAAGDFAVMARVLQPGPRLAFAD